MLCLFFDDLLFLHAVCATVTHVVFYRVAHWCVLFLFVHLVFLRYPQFCKSEVPL